MRSVEVVRVVSVLVIGQQQHRRAAASLIGECFSAGVLLEVRATSATVQPHPRVVCHRHVPGEHKAVGAGVHDAADRLPVPVRPRNELDSRILVAEMVIGPGKGTVRVVGQVAAHRIVHLELLGPRVVGRLLFQPANDQHRPVRQREHAGTPSRVLLVCLLANLSRPTLPSLPMS